MLREQDVGHRVVVRRIVGVRDDRRLFSEMLGELIELTETDLTLATAGGPVRVPLTEVHRAKRVPPARSSGTAEIVALELAANEAWPAPVQERLGDWVLRAADGWTGRANSALAVGDPGRPLAAAVDAVQRWYADRGQPALINMPLPLAAPLGRILDERGWSARPPVLVQTVALATLLNAVPDPAPVAVELADEPSEPWLDIAAARKNGLPAAARHVLTAVERVRFAHGYGDDGELLAVARGTVTGGGRWLGLSLLEVLPAARRRGLARQLIRALAEWAADLGADHCFLQVEQGNTPAVTLYRRLGFTTHHSYRTRVAPECDAGGHC